MPDTHGFVRALADLQDTFTAAGVHATMDPSKVRLPGVFLKLVSLTGPVLSGGVANRAKALVSVYCCVQTQDPVRTFAALQDLVESVTAVLPAHSDLRHVALPLPAGGTPAAALVYDHALRIQSGD